ncbi:MAG: carboxypeptidase-like regulatory domain-containing protein [Bacteroidales bacterium]|nr:carboxypeptidase-like regulatory domain-containing protein [Bacteroidales bacterium]MCF8403025.1 carboxypeptidase-like regulatory domain-containing protein [Bacteroidales bacterium]
MKKAILLIIFAAFIGFVFAGNEGTKKTEASESAPVVAVSLSGTVMDFDSGEALTGVELTIEGTDIKTYTDFDGNFEFSELKPGNYNVIASYISYEKSLVENYTAEKPENKIDIKLQASN